MRPTQSVLIELQYFPPVQYFAHLLAHPVVHLEAQENYVKSTYRNRCHIASANGVQRLSVPLEKGKNQQLSIQGVNISYHQNWQGNHWHAIRSAYGNSPFFEHYSDELKVFYKTKKYNLLWDFNLDILRCCLRLLGIKTEINLTEEYFKKAPEDMLDMRGRIAPKVKLNDELFQAAHYSQVFEDRQAFLPNLSILDLIFCCGPAAKSILRSSILSS